MSLTIPNNSRGPVLRLTLPSSTPALDVVLRNVTTGKTLRLKLPASFDGDDLKLDFFRRTIRDQDGNDRSSLLSSSDNELWTPEPLAAGPNDIEIEVQGSSIVALDNFDQSAGNLHGKALTVGGTWQETGTAPNFGVDAVNHRVVRSIGGELEHPRFALASIPNLPDVRVEGTLYPSYTETFDQLSASLVVRYSDATHYLLLSRTWAVVESGGRTRVELNLMNGSMSSLYVSSDLPLDATTPWDFAVEARASGDWAIFSKHPAAPEWGNAIAEGSNAALASAGAVASGKVGIFADGYTPVSATLAFDSFRARDLTPQAYSATARLYWEKGYS
jgi:hypothetical protein